MKLRKNLLLGRQELCYNVINMNIDNKQHEEIMDYMREEHWADRTPRFISAKKDWVGKKLFGYIIKGAVLKTN